jgi:hypothetical protein
MLVVEHKWTLKSKIVDVESAFLNDNLEEEIYMACPDGMEHAPVDCLLLLKQFTVKVCTDSSKDWFCSKLCRPMSND